MSEKPLTPFEILARSRAALVRVVRMAFVVLITVVTLLYILKIDPQEAKDFPNFNTASNWWVPLSAALTLAFVTLAIDYLTPQKKLSAISGLVLGLISGLLATFAIGFILDLLVTSWELKNANLVSTIKVLIGISLCYLAISTILQTQDDFRMVIPYVEFAKQIRGPKPLLLDTSVLVDARITDIAATGFIQVPVVIPRFVIGELQTLADSSDKLKRTKGRRGLETIQKLQRMRASGLDITIDETVVPGKAVDQMLVELARMMPGSIATCDSGLVRVAGIQNVEAVNINDLGNALKPVMLMGTQILLMIAKQGEQPGQGVGYLDDGTMVVVDGAESAIGQSLKIEVSGTVQTSAGRLVFARLLGAAEPPPVNRRSDAAASVGAEASEPEAPMSASQGDVSVVGTPAEGSERARAETTLMDGEMNKGPSDALDSRDGNQGAPGPFGPRKAGKSAGRNPRR